MKRIIAFAVSLFFVFSCTKEATIKLPEAEEKLVVTCFLSPDEPQVSAVVRMSKPKFGPQRATPVFQDDVKEATVVLSDGVNSITLPFDATQNAYFLQQHSLPIVPGQTYFLTVSTPDGKNVSASTTIPGDSLRIESIKFVTRKQDSTSFEQDISVVVHDEPRRVNYLVYHFTNHIETRAHSNPNFPEFGGEYSWMHFDTDEKTEHTKYYLSTENGHFSSDTIVSAAIDLSVMNCSREFYLYNKSVSEGGFSSPFADPVMIYTNFDNGFGCFGAYRAVHRHIVIR